MIMNNSSPFIVLLIVQLEFTRSDGVAVGGGGRCALGKHGEPAPAELGSVYSWQNLWLAFWQQPVECW